MKRKQLYPELKKAKEDGIKAKLVRDKLYIGNKLFENTTGDKVYQTQEAEKEGEEGKLNYSRVFYSRRTDRNLPRQTYETPVRNKYSLLEHL